MEDCHCKVCGFDYEKKNKDFKDVLLVPLYLDINGIYYPDCLSIIRNFEADFLDKYKVIEAVFNNGIFKSVQDFVIDLSTDPNNPYQLPVGFSIKPYLRHSPYIVSEVYCKDCYKKKISITI